VFIHAPGRVKAWTLPATSAHSIREPGPLTISFRLDLKVQMEVKKLLATIAAIVTLVRLLGA